MEKQKAAIDNRTKGRLSKSERRQQLLETARLIVREEGADRLTLGHLAVRAGVSKPVTYEHFETRTGLLIELYRWIDTERIAAFRTLMAQEIDRRKRLYWLWLKLIWPAEPTKVTNFMLSAQRLQEARRKPTCTKS